MDNEDEPVFDRREVLKETFTPTTPVRVKEIFQGRLNELRECLAIDTLPGSHAILYGERGVGKTSMANVFEMLVGNGELSVLRIDCQASDTYDTIVRQILNQIPSYVQTKALAGFHSDLVPEAHQVPLGQQFKPKTRFTPKMVVDVLSQCGAGMIIILDEFDRLSSRFDLASFTETLKIASDRGTRLHFFIVGVGSSVTAIIGEHRSITRNLTQIQLEPMSEDEIRAILVTGASRLQITFAQSVVDQIVEFSCGYPHYAHLLAYFAVTNALNRERFSDPGDTEAEPPLVGQADLDYGIGKALEKAQETLKASYRQATISVRDNIFKEVLQACGRVELDEYGTFQPKDLIPHLQAILKRAFQTTQFGTHLKALTEKQRGQILEDVGERGRRRYRFRDPLMRAFVKMSTAERGAGRR